MAAPSLDFRNRHNSVVSLAATRVNSDYHEILAFLRRSRINHVLTDNPPLYSRYLNEFWINAGIDKDADPPVVRSIVANREISFTRHDIQDILELGNDDIENGPIEVPKILRMEVFRRMGYEGDVEGSIDKGRFCWQWRYFVHVVVQALSWRKSGWDNVNAHEQSAIVSLALNRPYSISGMLFHGMELMCSSQRASRFILYPRFIAKILQRLLPDLPPTDDILLVQPLGDRVFADYKKVKGQSVPNVPLFGHAVDEHYLPPPDNAAAHPYELAADQQAAQPQQPHRQPSPPHHIPQPSSQPTHQPSTSDLHENLEGCPEQVVLDDILTEAERRDATIDRSCAEQFTDEILRRGRRPEVEDMYLSTENYTYMGDMYASLGDLDTSVFETEPILHGPSEPEIVGPSEPETFVHISEEDEDVELPGDHTIRLPSGKIGVRAAASSEPSRRKRRLDEDPDFEPDEEEEGSTLRLRKRRATTTSVDSPTIPSTTPTSTPTKPTAKPPTPPTTSKSPTTAPPPSSPTLALVQRLARAERAVVVMSTELKHLKADFEVRMSEMEKMMAAQQSKHDAEILRLQRVISQCYWEQLAAKGGEAPRSAQGGESSQAQAEPSTSYDMDEPPIAVARPSVPLILGWKEPSPEPAVEGEQASKLPTEGEQS